MKLLFTFISITLFFTCKSQAYNDSLLLGTISADIDGVTTTFNLDERAALLYPSIHEPLSHHGFSIFGHSGAAKSTTGYISVGITSLYRQLSVGVYADSAQRTETYDVSIMYSYKDDGFFSENPHGRAEVNITYLDSTSIQGTFGGVVINGSTHTPAIHTVTNGKFNLKLLKFIPIKGYRSGKVVKDA